MYNYTSTQLKYDNTNQRSIHNEPLLSLSKAYTVREVEVPLSELYTSVHRTVSGREFFNYTRLRNVCVLDGGTGERRYIPSCGNYQITEQVIIRTSISARGENDIVHKGGLAHINRKVKEYVISSEDLKEKPVYIHELNVIITAEGHDKDREIPNLENELKRLNESIFRQAMHMYEHPAYAPYMLIPNNCQCTRSFYLVINNEICQLPFIEIDPNVTDQIYLCFLKRDPQYGSVFEEKVAIELPKIHKEHKIIFHDREYLFSTNYEVLKTLVEKEKEIRALEKLRYQKLEEELVQLREENKRLSDELAMERAKHNVLLNEKKIEYDNRKLDHDEKHMQTKVQIEEVKLKNEQDKWKSDVAKIAIGAVAGAIIVPLVKLFGAALLDVLTGGKNSDSS